jgi:citrate:succinate antiporter/L-tartrate/succinate antiporter
LAQALPGTNPAEVMLILCLPMGFMGVITPYGTGCSPLFFGSRYVPGPRFFMLGALFAAVYLTVFILVGIPWVRFILPYISMA